MGCGADLSPDRKVPVMPVVAAAVEVRISVTEY